jgi:DnaJ family protein C protein 7
MSADIAPANGKPGTNETGTPPPPPYSEQVPEEQVDPAVLAERTKEQGNIAFKAKRYGEAVNHYSKAIGASTFSSSAVIHDP